MALVVWDPITGDQQHLPLPGYPHAYCTGAVLCAAAGCDHLDCRGGPFKVVFVGTDDVEGVTWASEYSSEIGAWSASTTVDSDSYVEMRPSLLAGDALYFTLESNLRVLKYDLGGRVLSVIDAPRVPGGIVMTAEGGGLGFAGVEDYSLYLWSWEAGPEPEGIAGWVQCRVTELDKLLPFPAISVSLDVIGFAEGTDIISMSTDVGGLHNQAQIRTGEEGRRLRGLLHHRTLHELLHSR
uniref:F-box associated domain-containing protein n=1 Tax=Arundo donax TaxID=35708 RepID=A0A0A9FRM8_ARUDO